MEPPGGLGACPVCKGSGKLVRRVNGSVLIATLTPVGNPTENKPLHDPGVYLPRALVARAIFAGRSLIFAQCEPCYPQWFAGNDCLTRSIVLITSKGSRQNAEAAVQAEKSADAHQVRGQSGEAWAGRESGPSIQGSRSGGSPSRIFDKLVERASREMRSSLAWSSHKVRCPRSFREKVARARSTQPTSVGMGRHQVSNESLILAQNQRWRRA